MLLLSSECQKREVFVGKENFCSFKNGSSMLSCNKYFKIKINVLQLSDKAVYQDEIVHFLKGNIIYILCECGHR